MLQTVVIWFYRCFHAQRPPTLSSHTIFQHQHHILFASCMYDCICCSKHETRHDPNLTPCQNFELDTLNHRSHGVEMRDIITGRRKKRCRHFKGPETFYGFQDEQSGSVLLIFILPLALAVLVAIPIETTNARLDCNRLAAGRKGISHTNLQPITVKTDILVQRAYCRLRYVLPSELRCAGLIPVPGPSVRINLLQYSAERHMTARIFAIS